jgi:hypothetical protein
VFDTNIEGVVETAAGSGTGLQVDTCSNASGVGKYHQEQISWRRSFMVNPLFVLGSTLLLLLIMAVVFAYQVRKNQKRAELERLRALNSAHNSIRRESNG